MENSPNSALPENSPVVSTPEQVKSKGYPGWLVSVLVLVVGVMVGFGLRSFMAAGPALTEISDDQSGSNTDNQQAEIAPSVSSNQFQFFTTPATKRKSFPVISNDGILQLVSTTPGDLVIQYVEKVAWGSGALGLGESQPVSSPDMSKIALITSESGLRVMDSEGKLIASGGANLKVDFLFGWSPDSQKLAFHVFDSKLSSVIFPDGPIPQEMIDLKPKFQPGSAVSGFYLLDLEKKNVEYLAPISDANLIDWVDQDNLLITVHQPGSTPELPAIFNTQTYQANAADYKDLFKDWFGPQTSFSADGKKWAFTFHQAGNIDGPDSKATIILADFPNRTGTIVAEGRFAAVQGPIISPDGTKVIFRTYDVVNGPNFVELYSGGQSKRLFEGLPQRWIDNDSFLYALFSPSNSSNTTHATQYFKYDLTTGKSTELLSVQAGQ